MPSYFEFRRPGCIPRASVVVLRIYLTMILAIFGLFFGATQGCSRYDPSTFRGDGKVQDSGPSSFPRYRITMPTVEVSNSEKRSFKLNNLPSISATLMLHFESKETAATGDIFEDHESEIKKLPITISCQLIDEKGQTICGANAPIAEWRIAQSIDSIDLWHEACRKVPIKGNTKYQFLFDVGVPNSFSAALSFTPVFEGGGNETP